MSTYVQSPLPLSRWMRRRLTAGRSTRAWLLAWLGGPAIGVANGVTRELVYADRVGELTAHQISTAVALALFAGYFWLLAGRWPLPSARVALAVGATWLVLTVGFEFGFGHYVDGKSWSELLADYDLTAGHVWPLVLVWLGLGPLAVDRLGRLVRETSPGAPPARV